MANDDLRWFTKRGTIRIIPSRYRAGVAVIVAALLFYNLFGVVFSPTDAGSGACGSLARPATEIVYVNGDFEFTNGWPWDSVKAFTQSPDTPDTSFPDESSVYLSCPRTINGKVIEFVANFVALWICGWYLRRAMREDAEGVTPGEASTSEN
jgi:hypothetical protein